MQVRRATAAASVAALGLAVATAPAALAGHIQVSSAPQTHPRVSPKVGGQHRTFHLTFTLTQAPSGSGLVRTDYRAVLSAAAHAPASCSPPQPAAVFSGRQGSEATLALKPRARGWCKGRYLVTVWLQRTEACGPPVKAAEAAIVCPQIKVAFPVNEVNTGEAHFTVN